MELNFIQKIAIWALPLVFAITVHEVAHGWVAYKLGDPTAKLLGRLSLNPLKHIDLAGTIIIPAVLLSISNFVFGWAKPVPIDPRNFKRHRRDTALVALAGPFTNLLMALIWGGVGKLGMHLVTNQHVWLGLPLLYMGGAGIIINVVLGVLNLLPFPPLDGSKIIYSILPDRTVWGLQRLEPMGFFILMFLWATGLLSFLLGPPIFYVVHWITAVFGLNTL